MAVGKDAACSVAVRQLPDVKTLAFKTLQSYDDGRVNRWVELEKSTGGGQGHSAPVLELQEVAPGTEPLAPSPSASSSVPATPTPSSTPSSEPADPKAKPSDNATAAEEEKDFSLALPIGIVVVVLALAGGLWWFLKRRRTGTA
ncbi:YcnI family protein [Streptomyces globisporus]|nr:YcnI family protein [Streptomyces globisporus]